jgi:hypothetical protein
MRSFIFQYVAGGNRRVVHDNNKVEQPLLTTAGPKTTTNESKRNVATRKASASVLWAARSHFQAASEDDDVTSTALLRTVSPTTTMTGNEMPVAAGALREGRHRHRHWRRLRAAMSPAVGEYDPAGNCWQRQTTSIGSPAIAITPGVGVLQTLPAVADAGVAVRVGHRCENGFIYQQAHPPSDTPGSVRRWTRSARIFRRCKPPS